MSGKDIWDQRHQKIKKGPKNKKSVSEKVAKPKTKQGRRKAKRPILKLRYLIALGLFFIVFIAGSIASYFYIFKDLPSPKKLAQDSFPVSTEIYDRHGTLLYQIYADQNRKPIKLGDLPPYVKNATIAIEDKDFYHHSGFDIAGILRAAYKNIAKGEKEGGSTITQQLIKTTLLTPEKTIKRKLRELILSGVAEMLYSKDEILEMYLNHIPYGGTAYGIEQAAQRYFDKHAKDLSLAEAALLAGLPQAPSRYSPFGSTPELAKNRQEQVLKRMLEDGYITQEEYDGAKKTELNYAKQRTDIKAPHFVMYVKDLLVEKYGQRMVEQGGLRVKTSLDLEVQDYAQASVSAEIAKLDQYKVSNGAALVTNPSTGEILAMVGSRNYFDEEIDGNVNLTTSLRQPGSSIKPLNYALGLLKGYTAANLFLDIPTCFAAAGQPTTYCPKNYDGSFHGPVQMRQSLANSYNIPAVKMLALNGLKDFIATASAMGISTWKDPSNYGLSLTLGGGEVKMVDMAVAFGVFANSGIRIDLNPILKVSNYKGEVLEEYNHEKEPPAGKRILPAEVTFIISNILSDNNARTPAFGSNSELYIPGKTVSVKTGTTDDLRDNWTIGYTPELVTAVWVGNNDNSKMNPYVVSGVTGAAPIWHDIMSYLLKDRTDVIPPKPENVIGTNVCLYKTATADNPEQTCEGRFEYFIKGTESNMLHGSIEKKNTWIDKETERPPLPEKTDNLELQEKTLAADMFTTDYCIDCPHENEPATTITMEQFYEKLKAKKEDQDQIQAQ
ncbi:PBP1A family penicillin-binding protein [Candidatus Beckwithbacteria bacterium]|nr:PBP1A family penicillin-binding protein [Candidatus Beckwithbacteria bacterium]